MLLLLFVCLFCWGGGGGLGGTLFKKNKNCDHICSIVFVNAAIKQPIIVYFHHYTKARSELSTDV